MPAIVEGWIDKVLSPPWAFRFKHLVGNYGYPIGNLKDKKAIIFCTYGSPRLAITTFFLNLPIRRLKRGVFYICGITGLGNSDSFSVFSNVEVAFIGGSILKSSLIPIEYFNLFLK